MTKLTMQPFNIYSLCKHQLAIIQYFKQQPSWPLDALAKKLGFSKETLLMYCKKLQKQGAHLSIEKTLRCHVDWLNGHNIRQHLPKNLRMPPCYLFNTLPSSNDTLLTLAKIQKETLALCLTEHQSQGRGRQKHHWASPLGCNLYFSLLHPYDKPHTDTELSEKIAHWVVNAIHAYGIQKNFTVKPPNDIVYQGKKLCGILIETICRPKHASLIIGIGVNLNMTQANVLPVINQTWTDLAAIAGEKIDRNRFCACLLTELIQQLADSIQEKK